MRSDPPPPQIGDEAGCIIGLVGADGPAASLALRMAVDHRQGRLSFGRTGGMRSIRLHDKTVAVLDQGMPHETKPGFTAPSLLVEPGVRVGCRGVRAVAARFVLEIAFAVSPRSRRLIPPRLWPESS